MSRRRGFTLLELLIAAVLIAVVATVLASAFAAGFRVWQRTSQVGGRSTDALIALEMMEKDIHNTIPCRMVAFSGGEDWVEIPSVVTSGLAGSGSQSGCVRYEFNTSGKGVDRILRYFPFPDPEQLKREQALDDVQALRFLYMDRDANGKATLTWTRGWTGRTNSPVAMKVMFTVGQGGDQVDLERAIVLPVR